MRKFVMIWIGELISNIGSGMTAFALSIYVYQMTGSVSYVSLVTLLAYLPTILLSPVGGVLADRYDRRLLMILGDLCSGMGLLLILSSIQMGNKSIVPILVGVTVNAVFVALLEPAYKATVTDLLTKEDYAKASGMVQIAGNARYLISPALAGVLLSFADIRLILVLDIASFLVTVAAVAAVRKTLRKGKAVKESEGIGKELKEGFSMILSNGGLLALVAIMALLCFFLGFLQTLVVPMVLAVSDAGTVGIMESVCAVGMLVSSLLIGIIGIKRKHAGILFITSVLAGTSMMFSGISTNLYITGCAIFAFFFFIPYINTCADVLLRIQVPNEVQGRVWGIVGLLTQAGTVLAYAVCGVIADYVFEPMFAEGGILAGNVGRIIGTGKGRGIGLLLILSGIGMIIAACTAGRNKKLRAIQVEGRQASVS